MSRTVTGLAGSPVLPATVSRAEVSGLPTLAVRAGIALWSTDLFDTVLLRDHTTQTVRLGQAARRVARLHRLDPTTVVRTRLMLHAAAYRAVAVEGGEGEASLMRIWTSAARVLRLDPERAGELADVEVDTDREHLRADRRIVDALRAAAAAGIRVVAVSDTYYSGAHLDRLLGALAPDLPLAQVYSSTDLGLTKKAGGIFAAVADAEGVEGVHILHWGDDHHADFVQPRVAGWRAIEVPRERRHRVAKLTGKVLGLPAAYAEAR